MSRLLTALRATLYAAGFLFLWGWIALRLRPLGPESALPPATRVMGALLMALGGALVLTCVVWFVVEGRGTAAPFDPPRAFVARGPYRWVRNPMYLGGFVLLVGFGLWHRSLAMVLFVVPAFVLAHLFVVLYEEPALRRRFGTPYLSYSRAVNRWIPKLRPAGLT